MRNERRKTLSCAKYFSVLAFPTQVNAWTYVRPQPTANIRVGGWVDGCGGGVVRVPCVLAKRPRVSNTRTF